MPTKAQATGAVGAGEGGAPLSVTLAPPPYVVRAKTGTALPTSPVALWEAVGPTLVGAGLTGVLTALLQSSEQVIASIVSGGIGTVAAFAAPIGTWAQEIGMGAMSSSAFALFLTLTNQMPWQ